jgi:hypothetical protein
LRSCRRTTASATSPYARASASGDSPSPPRSRLA